jgi:death-on-curing protein
MNRVWKHFATGAVVAIHEQVLAANGGAPGIRDAGMLESAIAAPQATWSGNPIMDDPHEIAAAYLFYLCRNHPFVDGNKRTALAACLVFLDLNGVFPAASLPLDEAEQHVLDVAASRLDRASTTKRLRRLLA